MSPGIQKIRGGFSDSRWDDDLSTYGGLDNSPTYTSRPYKGKEYHPSRKKRNEKPRLRISVRKLSRERVLDMVREQVIEASKKVVTIQTEITVEGVAAQLQVQPSKVHYAFMVLNREGLLSQGINDVSPRWEHSFWRATKYHLRKQRVMKDAVVYNPNSPSGTVETWDEEVPPRKKSYSKKLQRRKE